ISPKKDKQGPAKGAVRRIDTLFAEVATTIANNRREPEDKRELTHQTSNKGHQRKVKEELGNLSQKIEQIALNYAVSTSNWPKSRKDGIKEPRRDITCFRYGEIVHIARRCLSERKPKRDPEERQSKKRHQPYPINREKRVQTQPVGTWENLLRGRDRENELPQTNTEGEPDLMEEAFVDYEDTEDRPPQEIGHVVEVYQLGDLNETEMSWIRSNAGWCSRHASEVWWNMEEVEEENFYGDEEQGSEKRGYIETRKSTTEKSITGMSMGKKNESMNLEEMYIVDDHWEIEAEERYLTATANHVTKGNRWYEEEEFEVYLAIAPNKTDPNETNAAPRDPTLNQSGAEKDQDNVTRRPILDKGFARRMEYQDLIIDMQEGGAGCIVVEEDLKPEYEEA
ncbi:3161_t:CDS:10, partial [Gigaspora rosea]